MQVLYVGVPFVVVGMVGMSSMRATGDTRLPSLLMIIASIANIILDPIMIFGLGPIPAMGLKGAAMAALIARGAIFLGTIYLMHERINMLSFRVPKFDELRSSWGDILHVGIPAAGTNAIIPVATAVITAMLAQYGTEAVAGFGVASRIESLVLVMFYALSAVIGPFIGQNLSAAKAERIHSALRLCSRFCLLSGIGMAVFLLCFSEFLPSLFSKNPTVTGTATLFLLIAPISYGAYGIVMAMNASFNGMGKPGPAVVISVARMIIMYLPLAYLLRYFYGISGIFMAYAIANIFSAVIAYKWANNSVKGQIEKMN
jgi:putative MATE family efflux protein